jgi:hypothetical protein
MRVLTAAQSKARIKKLRKQGKIVRRITLPDGTVVVATNPKKRNKRKKRNPCVCGPNPLMHVPKLKGRGRPSIKRSWDMVTRLRNGMIAETRFKATKAEATAKANRILRRKFHGSAVAEIILDDGK